MIAHLTSADVDQLGLARIAVDMDYAELALTALTALAVQTEIVDDPQWQTLVASARWAIMTGEMDHARDLLEQAGVIARAAGAGPTHRVIAGDVVLPVEGRVIWTGGER